MCAAQAAYKQRPTKRRQRALVVRIDRAHAALAAREDVEAKCLAELGRALRKARRRLRTTGRKSARSR
jgi:hypothetical protein